MLLSPSACSRAADREPPLSPHPFPPIDLSSSKRDEYRALVRRRVRTLLVDEQQVNERRAQEHSLGEQTDWKVFRRLGDLTVYRRRGSTENLAHEEKEDESVEEASAVARGHPRMVVYGTMKGTIEDMLYGVSATSQNELFTGFSVTAPLQNAALLSVLESSTRDKPLQSAELLWLLTKIPLFHPRDVCVLKATGVETDPQGVSYGYLVLHSVNVTECPPFEYHKTRILRAKMFFSFLFRETTPGSVQVLGRGVFDLAGGELLKLALPHATSVVMEGLLRGMTCGEAKKLTVLARRFHEKRKEIKADSKRNVCSMCLRGHKGFVAGIRLRSCNICGLVVCKNCKAKEKRMFTGTKRPWRHVTCCPMCAHQAKHIKGVRLGEPEYVVVAEMYSSTRPCFSSSFSLSASRSVMTATVSRPSFEASIGQNGIDSHEYLTDLEDTMSDTGTSAGVTNSTIDDEVELDVRFPSDDMRSSECCVYFRKSGDFDRVSVEVPNELKEKSSIANHDVMRDVAKQDVILYERSQLPPVEVFKPGTIKKETPGFTRQPNNMVEWMMQLQSSAEKAYNTTKANGEMMKKSMR